MDSQLRSIVRDYKGNQITSVTPYNNVLLVYILIHILITFIIDL